MKEFVSVHHPIISRVIRSMPLTTTRGAGLGDLRRGLAWFWARWQCTWACTTILLSAIPRRWGEGEGCDWRGIVLVVILRLVRLYVDVREPLAGDDETDGEAVISLELLSVGLVGNEDVIRRVRGTAERNGSTGSWVLALRVHHTLVGVRDLVPFTAWMRPPSQDTCSQDNEGV